MGVGRQKRVGLSLGFVGIAAEVIGIGPRVMGGNALIALGIFGDGLLGIEEAPKLALDPLEARYERRIDRLVPRRGGP